MPNIIFPAVSRQDPSQKKFPFNFSQFLSRSLSWDRIRATLATSRSSTSESYVLTQDHTSDKFRACSMPYCLHHDSSSSPLLPSYNKLLLLRLLWRGSQSHALWIVFKLLECCVRELQVEIQSLSSPSTNQSLCESQTHRAVSSFPTNSIPGWLCTI